MDPDGNHHEITRISWLFMGIFMKFSWGSHGDLHSFIGMRGDPIWPAFPVNDGNETMKPAQRCEATCEATCSKVVWPYGPYDTRTQWMNAASCVRGMVEGLCEWLRNLQRSCEEWECPGGPVWTSSVDPHPINNTWLYGYGSIPINTIFSGMNIHKSQLFWCSPGVQGFDTLPYRSLRYHWLAPCYIPIISKYIQEIPILLYTLW